MFKAPIVLTIVLSAVTARAAATPPQPQQVAILDTISFTPALERVNARQKVEESVASAVRSSGWEPVTVTSDCRDIGCASTLAAQAGVSYVLILVGRFIATDTYATDVGVDLWHDGTVVGTRTETQEDAERASGTGGPRCGPPDGTCTPQLLESKLQQYAAKVLDDENAAVRSRRLAAITPPAPAQPAPVIAPAAPAQNEDGGRVGRIVRWSLVGAGVVLGGGAVGLWAANSSKTHCSPAAAGDGDGCKYQWHTTTPAIVLGVAGAAAAAAGVVLLISERPSSRLALTVHASGIGFEGSF